MKTLIRTLFSIAGTMIGLIAIGTIFALTRPPDAAPLFTLGRTAPAEPAADWHFQSSDIRIFAGIGRLRIPLANSSVMILSIAFPYPADDIAFTEELASRIGDFKAIAIDYFSSLPVEQLIVIDEEAAKAELLRRYNATLRLGRIGSLYFSDLLIIDSLS